MYLQKFSSNLKFMDSKGRPKILERGIQRNVGNKKGGDNKTWDNG